MKWLALSRTMRRNCGSVASRSITLVDSRIAATQFESHRTVNPNDVENAAWHFLCVARQESPEKAKAALLPVGPDSRAPMREIYRMFRGELTPQQVIAGAGSGTEAQFYAHLYAGVYYEALGDKTKALAEFRTAAQDRYAVGWIHAQRRSRSRETALLALGNAVGPPVLACEN